MAEVIFIIGDDGYLVDEKISQLAGEKGFSSQDMERPQSWQELAEKICAQALFAAERFFLLDYGEMAKWALPSEKALVQVLTEHANIVVVRLAGKGDRRHRLFKAVQKAGKTVQLRAPRGRELTRWVMERAGQLGGKIGGAAAAELVFTAGSDLRTLNSELVKLASYNPDISRESVRMLATRTDQASIFDLVDAAGGGKTETALALVEQLYNSHSDTPYLLQMLARQYRLLFQVLFYKKRGYGSEQVQKELAVHPYVFGKLWRQASRLSQKHCAHALQLLAEADFAFKSGYPNGLVLLQSLLVKTAKK